MRLAELDCAIQDWRVLRQRRQMSSYGPFIGKQAICKICGDRQTPGRNLTARIPDRYPAYPVPRKQHVQVACGEIARENEKTLTVSPIRIFLQDAGSPS